MSIDAMGKPLTPAFCRRYFPEAATAHMNSDTMSIWKGNCLQIRKITGVARLGTISGIPVVYDERIPNGQIDFLDSENRLISRIVNLASD
jgi:hypothetical protein